MIKITKSLVALLIFTLVSGCQKTPCNMSLRIGEIVQIPIIFNGFDVSEIDSILIYRIDNSNISSIDTFYLREILWINPTHSTSEMITDNQPSKVQKQFDYYDSYLDNCDLIFNWTTGKDTLLNIEIKKSQEKIEGCHENDPNVRIDKLTFIHKGKTISKNESIQFDK